MTIQASDISMVLSGGSNNTAASLSLGGSYSFQPIGNGNNNLFNSLEISQAVAGQTDYRCIYIKNNSTTESLYVAKIFTEHQIDGGGEIGIGTIQRNDIQRITIQGSPSSGYLVINYDGSQFNENISFAYNADLAVWATNLSVALNESVQIKHASVNASGSGNTTVFTITFDQDGANRYENLFVVAENELVGQVAITIAKIQDGSPILHSRITDGGIVPLLSSMYSAPPEVEFFEHPITDPIEIGTLSFGERLPIWIQRTVWPNTPAIAGDGFSLRISGNPLSVN